MHARPRFFMRHLPSVPLLLVSLAISVCGSHAQTFSTPMDVVPSGGAFLTPLIAVDSANNIDLAWLQTKPNAGVFFVHSTDGGKTFSLPVTVFSGSASVPGPAQIAVDRAGNINLIWQGMDASGATTEFFSRSTDGGKAFSSASNLSSQPPHVVANSSTQVNMLLDNSGIVNFVWSQYDQRGGDVLFSRTTDGVTFSTPVSLGGFVDFSEMPQMAFGSQGDIYVFWSEGTERNGCKPWFTRSTDDGSTFSTAMLLNTNACAGKLVVDSDGGIDIWGNPPLFRSTDRGLTFSVVNRNPPGGSIGADGNADLDVLSIGPLTCSQCSESDLYFTQSSDHGATFSTPRVIESTQNGYNFRIQREFMLLDARENINVAWEDSTAYGPSSLQYDILFSRSGDAGKAFSPQRVRISDAPAWSGRTSVALDSAGSLYAVWEGQANNDLFFSRDDVTQSSSGGISGSVAPTSATIAVGASATFDVSLKSTGGFVGAMNLGCGGAPSGVNCSFAPSHVDVTADGTASSALTVQVSAKPSLVPPNGVSRNAPPLASPSIFAKLGQGIAPDARIAVFLLAFLSALLAVILGGRDSQRTLNLPAWLRWRAKSLSFSNWVTERFFITCRGRVLTMPSSLAALVLVLVLAAGLLSCGGTTSKSTSTTVAGTAGTTGTTGTGGMGGAGGTGGMGGSGGSGGSGGGTGGGTSGSGSSVTVQLTVQAQSAGATTNLGTVSITVP